MDEISEGAGAFVVGIKVRFWLGILADGTTSGDVDGRGFGARVGVVVVGPALGSWLGIPTDGAKVGAADCLAVAVGA